MTAPISSHDYYVPTEESLKTRVLLILLWALSPAFKMEEKAKCQSELMKPNLLRALLRRPTPEHPLRDAARTHRTQSLPGGADLPGRAAVLRPVAGAHPQASSQQKKPGLRDKGRAGMR